MTRRVTSSLPALVAVTLGILSFVGCGTATKGEDARFPRVVARFGNRVVTGATLAHWMQALAPQRLVPDPPQYTRCVARLERDAKRSSDAGSVSACRHERRGLIRQTLDFLITGNWLLEEAESLGLGPSEDEIKRALAREGRSFANGETELAESLRVTGRTIGDLEFEVATALARQKLRRRLMTPEPDVRQIALALFKKDPRLYRTSEKRDFILVETFPKDPLAKRRVAEVLRRRSLAGVGRRESLLRREVEGYNGKDTNVLGAIFAAPPHVIRGPLMQDGHRFVFEITRVVPSRPLPYAAVRKSLETKVVAARWRRAYARFITAWRNKWVFRTDCSAGYVVQQCRQYKGAVAAEDPLMGAS